MIISSDQITSLKEELDKDCIGQCMLLSLREQRKDNVLCDAIIKCCNKEFPVHRSVLYAYSLYCRKLLLGSFPPKTENGTVEIDLDCSSENAVTVLLDVMYDDTSEESVNIDIEDRNILMNECCHNINEKCIFPPPLISRKCLHSL